ncbi:MAG: hypothetical protein AABX11_02980 [Nanoarchaeota archaeon]
MDENSRINLEAGDWYTLLARQEIQHRNFGDAKYLIDIARAFYSGMVEIDKNRLAVCSELSTRLGIWIMDEFLEVVREKGLKLTEENVSPLLEEHSPSLVRLNSIRTIITE